MKNLPFHISIKIWVYKNIIIPIDHKKMKRATRYYWDELYKAEKSGNVREHLIAAINLNQALSKYRQQRKEKKSFYKYLF